jgi:hypothetical protein
VLSSVNAFAFTVTVEAQTTSLAPPEAFNNGSGTLYVADRFNHAIRIVQRVINGQ